MVVGTNRGRRGERRSDDDENENEKMNGNFEWQKKKDDTSFDD